MDEMCNILDAEDLNKTKTNSEETEVFIRSESPVFKCFHSRTNRAADSSDYDIPSYQINQLQKSRTSSKCENDFVLPFSPVCSPISVNKVQFQPPSIHSLGTIVKNMENVSTISKPTKQANAFQSLGITDKDISWVSSMASPPPKQLPGSKFNTLEKATFLPENKFKKIQPRALFSPTSDTDCGCQLICSDSEDEAYETNVRLSDVCATLKQLEFKSSDSDVKDTSVDFIYSPVIKVKKLESSKTKEKGVLLKSPQDNYDFSVSDNSLSKTKEGNTFLEDDSFQSMSFSCIDELCKTVTEQAETKPKKQFRGVKEFYPSKVKDVYKLSSINLFSSYSRTLSKGDVNTVNGRKLNKSCADKKIVRFDKFNNSKIDGTKRPHLEVSDVKDKFVEKKVKVVDDGWENLKEYFSESQMNVNDDEICRTLDNLEKTLASQESKGLNLKGNISQEKNIEEEKCNQCNAYPKIDLKNNSFTCGALGEGFGAGAQIPISEKSLNQPNCDQKITKSGFSTLSGKLIQVSDKALERAKALMFECEEEKSKSTASGKEKLKILNVSPQALIKDCDKKVKFETATLSKPTGSFQGFQTRSDKTIKVPPKSLEKAKSMMLECEDIFQSDKQKVELSSKQNHVFEEALKKGHSKTDDKSTKVESFTFWQLKEKPNKVCSEDAGNIAPENLSKFSFQGFSTGSGRQIKISDKALKKAKALMDDCDKEANSKTLEVKKPGKVSTPNFQGFQSGSGKLIKVTDEALKKAKALMDDCDKEANSKTLEIKKPAKVSTPNFQGFQSGSGKLIKVSDEALKKAKALMDDCDKSIECHTAEPYKVYPEDTEKIVAEDSSKITFKGFWSGSGKEIKISDEALKKAKALMEDCCNESPVGNVKESKTEIIKQGDMCFSTGYKNSIQVREEALGKGKKEMKGESSEELASLWMNELANDSFGENKTLERGEQTESVTVTSEDFGSDWDKIIPSWLHVYNTSPSIASNSVDITPVVDQESDNPSKPERGYIKSPVLGVGDRFYRKEKKRKLDFSEPTVEGPGTSNNLEFGFSAPFKKAKLMEMESVDVKAERERARELQEKTIKEKDKVKPLRGRLLERKNTEKRIKWGEIVGNSVPEVHPEELLRSMGVREDVLRVCINNAADFTFNGEDVLGPGCHKNGQGMPLGDGCLVILNDEGRFGVAELKRAFLASPGIQPNLVAPGWVENHYKWIVWKLAHYEQSFPRHFAGRSLTPNNLMLQLKYRYDREIDRNERSALKKILEKDDTSMKRMVLCVCGIKKVLMGESSGYELTMTDGWYSCPARVDTAMSKLIEEGKVLIGTKLQTRGAILVNCEQGISPLEIGGNVYLKMSTNSTRRVRWDTKLGFQKNPENFLISLGSILSQGGLISRVDVIIVRVYPVLYMEKMPGYHVTRNRRSEEKAEAEFRKCQEQRMEKIWAEVQSEMRHVLEKSKSESRYRDPDQEDELSQLVGSSSDPVALKKILSQEKRFGEEFSERIEKKLKSERVEKRNVSEFLRVKVVDFRKRDYNNAAVLCVWNPNEDVLGILAEGKVLSLMNVSVSNSSRGYKNVQMNTTRQTQYRAMSKSVKYPARKVTRLQEVSSKICPAFEEVDIVGMVVAIRDMSHGSRLSQVVYFTDLEFHFVGVVFWGSCRDYGWENVLKIRSIVACSNLQWKKPINNKEVPSLHVSENSIFTENPRQEYLKEEMSRLKDKIPKDMDEFLSKFEEELTAQLDDSKWGTNRSLDNSKWRLSNEFESKPSASSTPIKPFSIGRSSAGCAEPSPIQKRIEKLQKYGEPPPLMPLLVKNRKLGKKVEFC